MIINVNKNKLVEAISQVSRVVGTNPIMDILQGIKLTVLEDKMELFATNMDISIKTTIDVEVIDVGEESIVIGDGKLLEQFAKKLKNGDVMLSTEDNKIMLVSGKSKAELLTKKAEDYPTAPEVVEERSFHIQGSDLKELIKKTAFAVASDSVRPILTGILFEIKDSTLNLVALDGLRVSHTSQCLETSTELSVVVPGKGANEISKILTDEEVTLTFGKNHVNLKSGTVELTLRLLEGEFIKYSSIIPNEFQTVVAVDRVGFIEAVERAALLTKDGVLPLVKLLVSDKSIRITSNSTLGKSLEEVEVNLTDGQGLEIAFNSKLLIDGLKVVNSEKVILHFNTNVSPCLLSPIDETEKYEYLVLPVRIV